MHIIMPDRSIFLHDDKHTASVKEQETTFLHDKTEYVPFKGALIYIKGATYPKKGFPTPEAVWAINQAKVVLRESLSLMNTKAFIFGFIFTWDKKALIEKALASYNTIAMRALKPYLIKNEYLCPTAYSVNNGVLMFLVKLGINQQVASDFAYILAHIFEYDDAYRYRLQDIASVSSIRLWRKKNFRTELGYLFGVYKNRETNENVTSKVEKFMKLVYYILFFKKIRISMHEAMLLSIDGMRYDEADWYWVSMRGDYLFGGKTYEERYEAIKDKPTQYKVIHE